MLHYKPNSWLIELIGVRNFRDSCLPNVRVGLGQVSLGYGKTYRIKKQSKVSGTIPDVNSGAVRRYTDKNLDGHRRAITRYNDPNQLVNRTAITNYTEDPLDVIRKTVRNYANINCSML